MTPDERSAVGVAARQYRRYKAWARTRKERETFPEQTASAVLETFLLGRDGRVDDAVWARLASRVICHVEGARGERGRRLEAQRVRWEREAA